MVIKCILYNEEQLQIIPTPVFPLSQLTLKGHTQKQQNFRLKCYKVEFADKNQNPLSHIRHDKFKFPA